MEINLKQLDSSHNLYLEQAIVDATKKTGELPSLIEVLTKVPLSRRSTIAQGCMLAKEELSPCIIPLNESEVVELISLIPEHERYTFLETTSKKIMDLNLFMDVIALIPEQSRYEFALVMEIPSLIGRRGGKSHEFEVLFATLPDNKRVSFALECVKVMDMHLDSPENSPRELQESIYSASTPDLFTDEQLRELNKLRFGEESLDVANMNEHYEEDEPVRKTVP